MKLQNDFLRGFEHAVFVIHAVTYIIVVVSTIWIGNAKWININTSKLVLHMAQAAYS